MFFNNNLYKFWSFTLTFFSLSCFLMGLVFLYFNYMIFIDWESLSINSSGLFMTFLFDWMSLIFMGCVLFISSMVILYSFSYMSDDLYKIRFLYLVLLFIFSMMLLIISPNLISILLGWDGLGLVSYCLVIYFNNWKSYNAGMLTVLTNRVGDVCILVSISWFFNTGGWNYIFYLDCIYDWYLWVSFLLIIASFTKSAQIPFSSWLPAAMAAPTPVSALVHSSTLVTAGVYLLIRWSNFILSMNTSFFLLISCLTMFMSGLGASFEFDLKKIIALSTLSQLGMMMMILFIGYPLLSYFHLLCHAFFKALLFLCAGLIIHCMNDSQDIRYMGYLSNYLPYTCSCFCISSLSLCGLPFLTGFYSKDLILEFSVYNNFNFFIYILYFISVGLTSCYSLRLVYYCMSGYNGLFVCRCYYEDFYMMFSMIGLTFFSVTLGSLLCWLIFPYPTLMVFFNFDKLMPLIYILLGGWLGYEFSVMNYSNSLFGLMNYLSISFLGSMWFMPYFSTYILSLNSLFFSKSFYNFMDNGWGEYLVSSSLFSFFSYLSDYNTFYQSNNIKFMLLSFIFVALILLFIM
uniref:NADH-ubiquinone oxidoreductase chain 5 n=1 Tax=Anaxandra taurina TaxID=2575663 RepID=A0A4D6X2P8_9HEMI|nr:NADH dehydrogenase subunit 5 [Anaxandra taurina]QCI09241.1 NADH dehydrogenase subunit 5 [Anaxandra taurina]